MTNKKKLLIVSQAQFGYHIDTYQYAKKLNDLYDITFFCWDYQEPKVSVPGVKVIYSSREGNILSRNLRFRREFLQLVGQDFQLVFIMYFPGASLAHLVKKRGTLICDVRTGEVSTSLLKRFILDAMLRLEVNTFNHKTFISRSLARRFNMKNYHVLPLGADPIPFAEKDFSTFHLVYVGVFYNRRIEDTVEGFGQFYNRHKDQIRCRYTIIGSGPGNERARIEKVIAKYQMKDAVKLTGYLQHDQLRTYLQAGNIGISYIPIEKYFDCQPPTKTFEYLMSGMAVLATSTKENTLVINEENGVLISDNAQGVAQGLEMLFNRRFSYDAKQIQEEATALYSWESIIRSNLHQYLTSLSGEKAVLQEETPFN